MFHLRDVIPLMICAMLILASTLYSQEVGKPDGTINDRDNFTKAEAQTGRHSLNAYCGRCHGRDGRGGRGPDLTDGVYNHVRTDKDIVDIISKGIPGTAMTGIGDGAEDFLWPVVAYIRSEGPKSKGKAVDNGDPIRGKKLYERHNCGSCHWAAGEGGRLGTDLTGIAATPDYVRESLRNPNALVDGMHQRVTLLDPGGVIIAGKLMSEDTFNMLIMSMDQKLLSVAKDRVTIKYSQVSLMPSFRDQLKPKDIEDLTSYVLSIKKAPSR
jgi:putative heme-binding domain-containing protein